MVVDLGVVFLGDVLDDLGSVSVFFGGGFGGD